MCSVPKRNTGNYFMRPSKILRSMQRFSNNLGATAGATGAGWPTNEWKWRKNKSHQFLTPKKHPKAPQKYRFWKYWLHLFPPEHETRLCTHSVQSPGNYTKFIKKSINHKTSIFNTPGIINKMYTPCINTNKQTNDILYDIFVYLQMIVHCEYITWFHVLGGISGVNIFKICIFGEL